MKRVPNVRSELGRLLVQCRVQEPVACVVCGRTVLKRRSATQPTRYCGGTCRQRAYRARHAARTDEALDA